MNTFAMIYSPIGNVVLNNVTSNLNTNGVSHPNT